METGNLNIMNIIQTKRLTKCYGSICAVNNLELNISKGEIFGLLGPNGAGKTTIIHMLATLLKPTSGEAQVNGYDIIKHPGDVRRSIGIVFQEPSSDDILTGYENLKLHAMLYNVPREKSSIRINELLQLVELFDRKDDQVKTYSGGMRRRLELARGLLHRPKILFLDEPTLGLDPQSRVSIWKYIKQMVSEEGITIILTTHYMEEADELCDRIGIIDSGKIIVLDYPQKLKKSVGAEIIRIKGPKKNIDKLNQLDYVQRVEYSNEIITIAVNDANKHLQQILEILGSIDSVELYTPTLNDVFIHFTGKAIREAPPEGGFYERAAAVRSGR